MGLRRYVKKTEKEAFLVVFFVLAGLAAYLTLAKGERAAGPPRPEAVAASEGMDKLWLEAALAKPDVRPVPDAGMFEREPEASAPALAPEPTPAPPPEPAPEPAPAFPTPRPAEEPLPAPKPRIAPMRDSMLGSGNSGNSSSAFLSYPKPAAPAAPAAIGGAAPGATAAAPLPAPKKRRMRPLAGP